MASIKACNYSWADSLSIYNYLAFYALSKSYLDSKSWLLRFLISSCWSKLVSRINLDCSWLAEISFFNDSIVVFFKANKVSRSFCFVFDYLNSMAVILSLDLQSILLLSSSNVRIELPFILFEVLFELSAVLLLRFGVLICFLSGRRLSLESSLSSLECLFPWLSQPSFFSNCQRLGCVA